jgi:hypothetical protein
LEAKLRIDELAIGHEEEKVWYAIDCLKGDAAKRIYPWVEFAKGTDQFTVCELFRQMDLAFADPQKESKAVAKINKIKQKGRPFRDFLQEFDQTLLEARGWAWASTVKKGLLKAALSRELTERLIGREEPADYADYCAGIRKVADDLQAWKESRGFKVQPTGNGRQRSPSLSGSMDWEPTRTTTTASARTRSSQSDKGTRAKWVSKDVRKQRWDAGACLRCGSRDHVQGSCHLRPAKPPAEQDNACGDPKKKSSAALASVKGKLIIKGLDTDDSEPEDSGKE